MVENVSGVGAPARLTAMRVIERGVYRGPHFYSHTPMIRIQLDLGELEQWPSDRLPGFAERLVALLPGLANHGCCFRVPGGFVRRLEQGTWLGHVAEHVALELQSEAGCRVTRGKTRSVKDSPGVYNVMYAYGTEAAGLLAGRFALALIDSLLPEALRGIGGLARIVPDHDVPAMADGFDLAAARTALTQAVRRCALGPTTAALVSEAQRRGIPVTRLDDLSFIQLGQGKAQRRLRASISSQTSHIAVETAGNKDLTKRLLTDAGLPVPRGAVVRTADEAVAQAVRIPGPAVVKPLNGNHGRGVTIGAESEAAIRSAFAEARAHSRSVIVEEMLPGKDHRILVVNGRMVAAAQRIPAHVIGDGVSTIAALVERTNRDPRRGDGHEKVMTRIVIDEHVLSLLAARGMTPESIAPAGELVALRDTANLSTGGEAVDVTDVIHPDNAAIACRAAQVIGLDIAGIDFMAPDIRQSVRETGGGIVEINAAPGFRMHLQPSQGQPRNVAADVIDMLFPRRRNGRIPIFAITGTNGKSTTARMLAHIMRAAGATVGLTSTAGVYVNDALVAAGDATGPRSARMVLSDPTVDVAVLETARGGMLREGLGFDRCDVGAVTNVAEDHLGLKGINTLEELAAVKSMVVEAVGRRGTSVLNADDPLVAAMARRAGGRIAWFSMKGGADMSDALRAHIDAGGLAVVLEPRSGGDGIAIHDRGSHLHLMQVGEIPATLDGLAEFNVKNALAAIAMAAAHGVAPSDIRSALGRFEASYEQNPGRLNVHDGHGFRVIMDYAHNPAGLRALCDVVAKLRPRYGRVIGMFNIPGDRRDEDARMMGAIGATVCDQLFFREDPGTRGRPPGEIMRLMREGALSAGFDPAHIHCIARESEAADACLRAAHPGDLVVLAPAEYQQIWQRVLAFQPVSRIKPTLRPAA